MNLVEVENEVKSGKGFFLFYKATIYQLFYNDLKFWIEAWCFSGKYLQNHPQNSKTANIFYIGLVGITSDSPL